MEMWLSWLWLIPALPLAGSVLLICTGGLLSRQLIAGIGVGSVGASAGVSALVAASFLLVPPPGGRFTQVLWTWIEAGPFSSRVAFVLDPLSLLMGLVITWVGLLIHVYAAEFMADDPGYRRFFVYMNLFVAAMVTLVLADNLFLLYLGWEGVGFCSYLLIGFWYEQPANGRAARKAFIITRIGDTAFAIGLFLLFSTLGTLETQEVMLRAGAQWEVGSPIAMAAALLLVIGAMGKSAQVPLHTWLPDAMAGPTPVSALIHAATMVTAGVYLLARMQGLLVLAPAVQLLVAIVGVLTLVTAGLSALVQRDIKRVLAYSTVSQIGYMFVALGVAAPAAAMFHFLTHACFKALLFLGAGLVSRSVHHELDMFRMGGLRRRLPVTFWTFLAGVASLAGLPLVTAGFYSKDWILWATLTAPAGGVWLWVGGAVGAFLTALYAFRLLFHVFLGEAKIQPQAMRTPAMTGVVIILALLSLSLGFLEVPRTMGSLPLFSGFLDPVFPADHGAEASVTAEAAHQGLLIVLALAGVGLAYVRYRKTAAQAAGEARPGRFSLLYHWADARWGADRVYDRAIVQPLLAMAHANRQDVVDAVYTALARLTGAAHAALSATQTGALRWYATVLAGSAVVVVWMMMT